MTSGDQKEDLVLEVASLNCAADDLDDEIMALRLDTGVYYSMRELSAALWRDLAAGHPVSSLADLIREATGSEAEFQVFVSEILEHGLMRAGSAPMPAGEPTITGQLALGQRDIKLEVFEDMKDLILSDPIHDVDEESGWPTPRNVA